MRIKLCGTTSAADAALASEAGADALGFLVGLETPAADELSLDAACAIRAGLPPALAPVLVTHRVELDWIAATCAALGCTTVQVHGPLAPQRLPELRALRPGIRIVKTVHVTGPEALEAAEAAARFADLVLLDTRTALRLGGTGRTHDWALSAEIVRRSAKPVVLAGGLTPENVREAIAAVRPAGVDVNSGVEDGAGRKDPLRVRAFVARAREALEALAAQRSS